MSKLDNHLKAHEKLNKVIKNQLPGFASRFFKAKLDKMSIDSLYGYSLDITAFFEYMRDVNSINPKDFSIKDLDDVSEVDIENFVKFYSTFNDHGQVKKRSASALRRCFFALNSFFTFYYKEDLIDSIPTLKVPPPDQLKKPSAIISATDTYKLLDFVENGVVHFKKRVNIHKSNKERDLAIISLIVLAGIKTSEITGIDIYDLKLDENLILIGTRRNPSVYITDKLAQLISDYLLIRLEITPEYGHEDAFFLSNRGTRMCDRNLQLMFKKYVTACFGEGCKIVPNNLVVSFRDNIYNQSKNISTTALLTGCDPFYIIKTYKADLDEKVGNTCDYLD